MPPPQGPPSSTATSTDRDPTRGFDTAQSMHDGDTHEVAGRARAETYSFLSFSDQFPSRYVSYCIVMYLACILGVS